MWVDTKACVQVTCECTSQQAGPQEAAARFICGSQADICHGDAAMSFLIPIGVVCYVAIGGLKATFTTSYMHTVIIYIICLVLMFKVRMSEDLASVCKQSAQ